MKIEDFANKLENELHREYLACEDFSATPTDILLAVKNAVRMAIVYADARSKARTRRKL